MPKEDTINDAYNRDIKFHVRGKGHFRYFRSRKYVPDKQADTGDGKKSHGIKHSKEPTEMNPAF
eukprot:12777524-Ditylum_brightwellii.AAC.1